MPRKRVGDTRDRDKVARARARQSVKAWKSECPAESGWTRDPEQSQERRGDAAGSGSGRRTDPRVGRPGGQGRKQHPHLQPKPYAHSALGRAR